MKKKRIIKKCEFTGCTENFEVIETSSKRFCCVDCQKEWQKYSQLGENNGNYGRKNSWGKHNKERRKIISEKVKRSWENPERHKKAAMAFKRIKDKNNNKLPWITKEYREKKSRDSVERMLIDDRNCGYDSCQKGYYISTKTKINEYHHSSWELERMIELDNDENVIFWTKKHGFNVKYEHDGIIKRYVPDFHIKYKNYEIVEEVKGYVDDVVKFKLKIIAAKKFFSEMNIKYIVNFMYNEQKYNKLNLWIKKLK